MRPACLRNARSLASAQLPLLPFLAPRAFAEAPFIRRQHDFKPQEEQEKKRGSRALLARNLSLPSSLGARYTDIFDFARQQLRSYSTEGAGGRVRRARGHVSVRRTVETRSRGPKIRVEPRSRRLKAQGRTSRRRVPRLSVRKVVSVWGKIVPWSIAGLRQYADRIKEEPVPRRRKPPIISNLRRLRRLRHLRRTLSLFQHHEAPRHPELGKTTHGKYRSLRRRVLALSARETQTINLHEPFDFLKASRGEYITMAFAAMDRTVYSGLKRRSYPVILNHLPICASWTARLFRNEYTSDADQMWSNWNAFDVATREQYWPHLLIYLLDKFPDRALPFMHVLTHQPCVKSLDARIIADAFEHLARAYVNKDFLRPAQKLQLQDSEPDFIPTFYHVFREHLAPYKRICSQDLLFCLPKLASIEDFQRVFDLLKESDAYIGYDVLLHYANTFAKAGDFRQALACLRIIVEGAKNQTIRSKLVDKERFRWSCALILHRSIMEKDNYHETTSIVATFVEFGVKLDILLYNVIMHNAMEAGDYTTAFKVYNTLNENGLKPDKITFSTLLHGCTMTGDPAKFSDFAEYCAETAKELKDPWLAADYLYYLFVRLHRESRNPEESLDGSDQIIRAYLRFFNPRALEPFWSSFSRPGPLASGDVLTESAFMKPPPVAVYIMLQLEILKATSLGKENVWPLYLKFTSLVETEHDHVLSALARKPIIWNAFLLSFCRAQHFEHASQLVQDMAAYGTDANIYTWNIFMQGFFKSRQIQAAERVFEIMRARGIDPDQFTYEILLRGYARAQRVNKIGEMMEHVDEEKQVSARLLRELARIHDQRRVLYELEKARIRKEEYEAKKREEKAERLRRRWAPPKFSPLIQPQAEPVGFEDGVRIKPLLSPASGLVFKSALKK